MGNSIGKRGRFFKNIVTNARDVTHLTEILKQKFQAKAQRIRGYEKGKPSIVRIRYSKKTLKKIYRNLGMKNIEDREPLSMTEAETYWKSLWG